MSKKLDVGKDDTNLTMKNVETQLREILNRLDQPRENLNLMQMRVAALKRIEKSVEELDRIIEFIETEMITIQEKAVGDDVVVYLHPQYEEQETENNYDLNSVVNHLKHIRKTLMGYK